jgi:hypothetical protein
MAESSAMLRRFVEAVSCRGVPEEKNFQEARMRRNLLRFMAFTLVAVANSAFSANDISAVLSEIKSPEPGLVWPPRNVPVIHDNGSVSFIATQGTESVTGNLFSVDKDGAAHELMNGVSDYFGPFSFSSNAHIVVDSKGKLYSFNGVSLKILNFTSPPGENLIAANDAGDMVFSSQCTLDIQYATGRHKNAVHLQLIPPEDYSCAAQVADISDDGFVALDIQIQSHVDLNGKKRILEWNEFYLLSPENSDPILLSEGAISSEQTSPMPSPPHFGQSASAVSQYVVNTVRLAENDLLFCQGVRRRQVGQAIQQNISILECSMTSSCHSVIDSVDWSPIDPHAFAPLRAGLQVNYFVAGTPGLVFSGERMMPSAFYSPSFIGLIKDGKSAIVLREGDAALGGYVIGPGHQAELSRIDIPRGRVTKEGRFLIYISILGGEFGTSLVGPLAEEKLMMVKLIDAGGR